MTNDNRQAAWDAFMQRLIPIAQDPEQVLGEPYESLKSSGEDDLERYWSWDGVPWVCSSFDQRDKRSRRFKWSTTAHPEAQYLVAALADNGTVQQLILIYRRAADAGTVQINYEDGKATPYANSIDPTAGDLPNHRLIEEFTQAIPERLLS